MNHFLDVQFLAKRAKIASQKLSLFQESYRQQTLRNLIELLREDQAKILEANSHDIEQAKKKALSSAFIDRLLVTEKRLYAVMETLEKLAASPSVLGLEKQAEELANGLKVWKKRVPLGVLLVIFESRPLVLLDCAALAIKSGNAILLKGGSDAGHTIKALQYCLTRALHPHYPSEALVVLPSGDRQLVLDLVACRGLIDLCIPRGGENLVRTIEEHAQIPVLAHAKGLCHLYVHEDAPYERALSLAINSKASRPSVCNALETLIIHEGFLAKHGLNFLSALVAADIQLIARPDLVQRYPRLKISKASSEAGDREYGDLSLNVLSVSEFEQAIAHIHKHGTQHTEAIVAEDPEILRRFGEEVDASCLMLNASTRWNDGGELGLIAEIGISTHKLHAYGPVGPRELTSVARVITGSGHCRI